MKGYLTRKSYNERLNLFRTHVNEILKIQSWWRATRIRQSYLNRLVYLKQNEANIVMLQSYVKMWIQKRKYFERLNYLKSNEHSVVKIQSYYRAKRVRDDYNRLINDKNPPFTIVLKFAHLLNHNNVDFSEEIGKFSRPS
jgi:Ras GTPase-activating-like protein IQGAP2/3